MANNFKVEQDSLRAFLQHLFQNKKEQAIFVFAQVVDKGNNLTFIAQDYYIVQPEDFMIQTEYHISLTDEAQGKIIKMAWDRQASLVELHSHPNPNFPVQFSTSDLVGLSEFVPHVWWRLKGKPYLAIVFGPDGGFDALVWRTGSDKIEPLDTMIAGHQSRRPTGNTLSNLRRGSYGRNPF